MRELLHRVGSCAAIMMIVCLTFSAETLAIGVDKPLADAALEARARAIHKQLRCLVCQNQAIDDSNADLARDLRVLVRERISLGESDQEVLDYVVGRYGDWVLLNPPFNIRTLALWISPVVLLLLGGVFAVVILRRQRNQPEAAPADLTPDEQARLKALLDDERGKS
tara:strand:- start:2116 stop:2616 length:501 start_codon:yes stop_codon:yes gene_type:complete